MKLGTDLERTAEWVRLRLSSLLRVGAPLKTASGTEVLLLKERGGEEEFLNFLFIAFWVTKFSPFSFESYNSFIPFSEKEAKIRESRNVFIVTQGMAELGHELGSSDSKFRTPALQQGRVRASD